MEFSFNSMHNAQNDLFKSMKLVNTRGHMKCQGPNMNIRGTKSSFLIGPTFYDNCCTLIIALNLVILYMYRPVYFLELLHVPSSLI